MISLKELYYVDTWARKAPFPGRQYALETLENMKEMFDRYKSNYHEKNYSIIFSDTTELSFEILESNICHMFGIDFKNLMIERETGEKYYETFLKEVLKLDSIKTRITSYMVAEAIVNNYEEVARYDEESENRILNYYKSRVKCAIFERMSEFENFNFGKLLTEDESLILYTPSNEAVCPYFLVRLCKNNKNYNFSNDDNKKNDDYCINSLMAPKKEEIASYFKYSAAIPTQMIIDDNKNLQKILATPKEKINMLNLYKSIITSTGNADHMDISGDYLATLAELDSKSRVYKK